MKNQRMIDALNDLPSLQTRIKKFIWSERWITRCSLNDAGEHARLGRNASPVNRTFGVSPKQSSAIHYEYELVSLSAAINLFEYTVFGSRRRAFPGMRIASQSLSFPANQFGERDSLPGWRGEQLFP